MKQNIYKTTYHNKEIILIATAHVSKESAELVEEVLLAEMPDSVCIELDDERYHSMMNPKQYNDTDLVQIIKDGKAVYLLANTILSSYQKKLAEQLDTEVGLEMKTAIEIAQEHNLNIVNADRNIKTTFTRIWRSLNFKDKIGLISMLLDSALEEDDVELSADDINELLEEDMLQAAMGLLESEVPTIKEILLDERDQYLAYKIKHAPGDKIVAVLGGAHVAGVLKEIDKQQDIAHITHIPPKSKSGQVFKWGFTIALLLLLLSPFITQGTTAGIHSLIRWSLWSGSLAAVATLLVGGHILSALSAFFTAPLAALHPLIAVGMIAGVVEATLRKPTVADVNNLSEDISSLKGWRRNHFIKALVIVFAANIGSIIGQTIGGFGIFSRLLK